MDSQRTSRAILRLYNVTFQHAILCTRVLFPPKAVSLGVMFGLYFHKVSKHCAEDTCVIGGYSRLAEHEERMFKELRQLAGSTTRRPEDVAAQFLQRHQLKEICTESTVSFLDEHDRIEKLAQGLPTLKDNTRFSKEFVQENIKAYNQAPSASGRLSHLRPRQVVAERRQQLCLSRQHHGA